VRDYGAARETERNGSGELGPVTGVFLRNPLTHDQVVDIGTWLTDVSKRIQGTTGNWELWMDGAPVGCPTGQHQCTILVTLRGPGVDDMGLTLLWEDGPEEIEQLSAIFGHVPEQEIAIAAMCNGRIDHCLIGRLALHFARTFDGVIDLCGCIRPPHRLWDSRRYMAEPVLAGVRAFVEQFPGTVWEIGGGSHEGELDRLPRHLIDTTFMEAWLAHPDFSMIK
jgi:Family of unknown function (DUF6368)